MKYVPPLPLRREVYSILRVKNVDHPEILTDLYLGGYESPSQATKARQRCTIRSVMVELESGSWTGHYVQRGNQSPQRMVLEFADGLLRGDGIDDIGPF